MSKRAICLVYALISFYYLDMDPNPDPIRSEIVITV